MQTATFSELNLPRPLLKALVDLGYEVPSSIQSKIIPLILSGRDVVGQAQTGTGKTAAFALPLLSRIDLKKLVPQVLVLAPTRELAIQVAEAFQRYATHLTGLHVMPIYGGQDYTTQLKQLKRGVQVIVGTPGRVMDHMRKGTLKLDNIACLVLDEADEMLRMGFIEDVEWVLEHIPSKRQVALFSATMPEAIRKIAKKYLTNPEQVIIKVKTMTAETIRQRYWPVNNVQKLDVLTRILETEVFDGMLIFVRTKTATQELATKLTARGYAVAPLSGDISQNQRTRTVEKMKSGQLDIVVATDVAARGLDIQRVSHVINYDIPQDTESYVHRIGRTGRAGRSGDAILFVSPREKRLLSAIEKATGKSIELLELPSTKLINDKRIARFTQQITDTLAKENLQFFKQLLETYQNEQATPILDIAAALAHLLQGPNPLLIESNLNRAEQFDSPKKARNDRKSFDERKSFSEKKFSKKGPELKANMETFRIEVGHHHKVKPGNIVGAIANETGLSNSQIGHIEILDEHSFIQLPKALSKEIFQHLQSVWVAGRQLKISRSQKKPEIRINPDNKRKLKKKKRNY